MDPDVALSQARAAVINGDHDALVEAFQALDGWFHKGGFLPKEWAKYQPVPVPANQPYVDAAISAATAFPPVETP